MRLLFTATSQISFLLAIYVLGHSLLGVLYWAKLLTDYALVWYFAAGRYLYPLINAGLLIAAMVALIMGSPAQDNRLVVTQRSVGSQLFKLWMLQNGLLAGVSLAAYVFMLVVTPPESRRFLLLPWW